METIELVEDRRELGKLGGSIRDPDFVDIDPLEHTRDSTAVIEITVTDNDPIEPLDSQRSQCRYDGPLPPVTRGTRPATIEQNRSV